MQIIAHRGASGYEPENTLSAFKRALEIGVDAIELDVYVLHGGELVVIHDDKVDRTTNGTGYVLDFTFEELRKLDAGNGQQIPTLQEVLDIIDMQTVVNIELKGIGTAQAVAQCIRAYVNEGWSEDHFFISSFNHVELAKFSSLLPNVRTGALITGIPLTYAAFAAELNAYSLNPSCEFLTQEFVDDAKARGLKVYAYTVDDESEILRTKALGVDGIFSNLPDKAKEVVSRY